MKIENPVSARNKDNDKYKSNFNSNNNIFTNHEYSPLINHADKRMFASAKDSKEG